MIKPDKKIVLIFDFDGVFYSGEHKFDNVESHVSKNRRKFLPNISKIQYNEICKNHPNWLKAVSGAEIVNCIYELKNTYPQYNISVDAFLKWQEEDIYKLVIDYSQVANAKFIENLCRKYPVYIVSNSSINHIIFYMKKLNINPNWFKRIYSNQFSETDRTKKIYYSQILEIENCSNLQTIVFGDSINTDLKPAQILGIDNYLINNANDIEKIVLKALGEKMKNNIIKEYLLTNDIMVGYFNMQNPNFDKKEFLRLQKELESLKKQLIKMGVDKEKILEEKLNMQKNGDLFEKF